MTLATISRGLVARYQGAYSSGQRFVPMQMAPDTNVAVSAARLRDLAALFDDDDMVTVSREGSTTRFATSNAALSLATAGAPLGLVPFMPRGSGSSVVVDAKLFLSEITLAAEFTAKSQARPILTGIRLVRVQGGLLIQASDGQAAIFERVIPCEGDVDFDVVSPAYDLVLGLKVCGGEDITLFKPSAIQKLQVFSSNAVFDCALMAESSKWPNDGFDRAHQQVERVPLVIPSQLLRNVLNSSKVLQAGNSVYLEGSGARVLLRTERSEIGEFATALDGGIMGRYRFDVDLLGLAAKIGEPPTFLLAGPDRPALITDGQRRFYMSLR